MKRSARILILGTVAGAACSVAVAAPKDTPARVRARFGGTLTPSAMIYQGHRYPVRVAGHTDDPQVVYDNGVTTPPAAFFTNSLPHWHMMDPISFNPGPGAGQPNLITSVQFCLGETTPTLPNDAVAVRYRIWDTINTANPVITSDMDTDITFIFAAPATGWAMNTYYLANPIDLTTLPAGGVNTLDDTISVDTAYFTTMIDPMTGMPVATTTPHPDMTNVFADFNVGNVVAVGSSDPTYYRDADGSGDFQMGELRGFAAPAVANFIQLINAVPGTGGGGGCYANCDHSTAVPFLNVNDFLCFQGKFAAGDTYANCDNSTSIPVLNVNDFLCFQGKFAAGCSAP